MSETLREVAVELAGRLASAYAGMYDPYSSDEFLKRQHKLMAGYMERIDAADQERTCELDLDISMERVKCSACGKAIQYGANLLEVKYCPHCGARVVSSNGQD